MVKPLDAVLDALDRQALYELHSLSDDELEKLPEKLQNAELRRRIILRARQCKDEKVLEEVLQILRDAKRGPG